MKPRKKRDLLTWASLKGAMLEIRARDRDRRVVARVRKGLRCVGIEISEKLEGSTVRLKTRLGIEAWDHIVRVFNDSEDSSDDVKRLLEQHTKLYT